MVYCKAVPQKYYAPFRSSSRFVDVAIQFVASYVEIQLISIAFRFISWKKAMLHAVSVTNSISVVHLAEELRPLTFHLRTSRFCTDKIFVVLGRLAQPNWAALVIVAMT